jgi:hypothetical protein
VVELRDGDAVALSNDLAARDLRRVGNAALKFSSVIHFETTFVDSLCGLEETERAQNAVVASIT